MIEHNPTPRAQALQEAAEWLVRLSDHELQDAEFDAWNAWMEASAVNAKAFEDVQLLWDAAAEVSPEQVLAAREARGAGVDQAPAAAPAVAQAGTVPQAQPWDDPGVTQATFQPRATTAHVRRASPRARARKLLALAAVAVVALAVPLGLLKQRVVPGPTELRLSADIGTPRKAELPDGSRIDLDAGSQVVVQFSSQRRQVELVRGQAYFSVAKDPARPFEVRADGALAQALGTHFAVAKRDDSVRVVVSEGHVQVSDLRANAAGVANHVVQLLADQSATLVEGGTLEGPVALDAGSSLAWLQGRVVYRSETLGNVVADLNRYSRLPIVLDDRQLAQLRVTGRWSTTDLDTWLESVAQALSLSIVRRQDEILLVSSTPDAHGSRGQDATPKRAAVRQ